MNSNKLDEQQIGELIDDLKKRMSDICDKCKRKASCISCPELKSITRLTRTIGRQA